MLLTNNSSLAKKARHLTTTARTKHKFEFIHDELGYNFRLPNINAALGFAQMKKINKYLKIKKTIREIYFSFCKNNDINSIIPLRGNGSNNWLFTFLVDNKRDKEFLLNNTNNSSIMTRPLWKLMINLPMFKNSQNDGLKNSHWLEDRVINIPSSVPKNVDIKYLRNLLDEIS